MQELVAYAKANPNQLVTANSGGFGLPDIAMAQLAKAAGGFKYRTVPTSGGAEQVLKLLAGDVQARGELGRGHPVPSASRAPSARSSSSARPGPSSKRWACRSARRSTASAPATSRAVVGAAEPARSRSARSSRTRSRRR